ncbi:MAG: RluA family pseudouridine synthase [Pseudomonadota bacterium]
MSGVQQVTVATGEGQQRLDRWLKRRFPEITQGRIEKACRKGEIRVDGGRVKPATRIQDGQNVRVPPFAPAPTRDEAAVAPVRRQISDADAAMIQAAVLWKDDHIIALNKPSGLPSQGGSKQSVHVDGLSEALRFGYDEAPRLVHRLDKDTSGVLLMARTRKVAHALGEAFLARETRKLYWAAVAGRPEPRMGTIRFGLVKAGGHGKGGEGEKMHTLHPDDVAGTPDAKHATTDYAVISHLGGRLSWAALVPVTGRTHQLRAHMAAIGHPIIGDGKYGGSGQENLGDGWGAGLGAAVSKKLHLHARSLSFLHPVTGHQITLKAPLPEHFAQTWDMLGWSMADAPEDPFDPDALT